MRGIRNFVLVLLLLLLLPIVLVVDAVIILYGLIYYSISGNKDDGRKIPYDEEKEHYYI